MKIAKHCDWDVNLDIGSVESTECTNGSFDRLNWIRKSDRWIKDSAKKKVWYNQNLISGMHLPLGEWANK